MKIWNMVAIEGLVLALLLTPAWSEESKPQKQKQVSPHPIVTTWSKIKELFE